MTGTDAIDVTNLQGLALSGYDRWPHAHYRLLRIVDVAAARRWLAGEIASITWGSRDKEAAKAAPACRNVALSYNAVRLLQPAMLPAAFPLAFRDGMTHPVRSRLLGDLPGSRSDPADWKWGGLGNGVDVVQLLFARTPEDAVMLCRAASAATQGALVDVVDPTKLCLDHVVEEHFGFADGKSQPAYRGVQAQASGPMHWLEPGELLMGRPDGDARRADGIEVDPAADPNGLLDRAPSGNADLGTDGTWLVMRQLRQDVEGFWAMVDRLAAATPYDRDYVAAKIVGRWQCGAPLKPGSSVPGPSKANDFLFDAEGDAMGHGCPFGSHIRRANPRDSGFAPWAGAPGSPTALHHANRRRLLRRGRLFGPRYKDDPDAERGLMFIALCADIERQFEFVQHGWLLNPEFAGLAGETDPLLDTGNGRHTLQEAPFARRLSGVEAHVWAEGGGYFFLPSRKALRFLAQPPAPPMGTDVAQPTAEPAPAPAVATKTLATTADPAT